MPEGPEVRITADCLQNYYVRTGLHRIHGINIDNKGRYREGLPGLPILISRGMFPLALLDVRTRGKKIIFVCGHFIKCDTPEFGPIELQSPCNIYFVSSLGMEGSWKRAEGKHSNLSLTMENIATGECSYLYFNDSRHFGTFDIILSSDQLEQRLSDVGPDLLQDDVTREMWFHRLRSPRLAGKQICQILMDQDCFSGIGNYLKAEVLYRARIRPDRIVQTLSDPELELLRITAINTIRASYQSRGLTIKTYFDIDGHPGTFQVFVYNRTADPYGNVVRVDKFKDGRSTHWVPEVQV